MNAALASTEPARAKRAVIYLRVSTQKQAGREDADGYSLPAQRDACERKAEALGADVIDVYVDRGESAKTAERPQFQLMLARIRDHRDVDFVILDKIDRFARNRRDDANLLFEIRMAGAQLVSVKENVDETPAGELLHAIMAGMAEFYSKNLATEALKGMTQKAMQGGTPGRVPTGYINTRARIENREFRTVAIDPERAPHVQWAYEQYATGEYSIRALTDALAERGFQAIYNGRAAVPGPLKTAAVHRLLTNAYYAGKVTFRGVEYQGTHEPLITEALYDHVQALLRSRYLVGEKARIYNHYLKSTVYCGLCGSRLCITNAKGQYMYYYCLARQTHRNSCRQPFLPVEAVEKAVERHYVTVRMTEAVAILISDGIRAKIKADRADSAPERSAAQARLAELDAERRRLARAVVSGAIPEDLVAEEQDRISSEMKHQRSVIESAAIRHEQISDTLTAALDFVGRAGDAYVVGDPQFRRRSNQFFFRKLLIGNPGGQVQVVKAELTALWAILLSDEFQASMAQAAQNATNPDQPRLCPGSRMTTLVRHQGLEPRTR